MNSNEPLMPPGASGATIGTAFGKASSSGFMRVGLFLGTNMAVVALLTALAAIFGIQPSGIMGIAIMSLLFGMGGAFISLMMSKKMALKSTGAVLISSDTQDPTQRWLYESVQDLSNRAGIGMPDVALFPSDAPNAFATGAKRDDALVAVSVGLLRGMNKSEVEAVLAHEIAHIANGDMITMTLIQGVLNSVVILISRLVAQVIASTMKRGGRGMYFMIVMALQMVLGFFASMIVMWFSRRREFRADSGAAALVGAEPMQAALAKLKQDTQSAVLPDEIAAFGIRTSEREGIMRKLLTSHPALDDRIAALNSYK